MTEVSIIPLFLPVILDTALPINQVFKQGIFYGKDVSYYAVVKQARARVVLKLIHLVITVSVLV